MVLYIESIENPAKLKICSKFTPNLKGLRVHVFILLCEKPSLFKNVMAILKTRLCLQHRIFSNYRPLCPKNWNE
jgi:hypothetical protein